MFSGVARIGGMRPARIILYGAGGLAGLLVILRVAVPIIATRIANQKIDRIDGYTGSLGDIDLALWRGEVSAQALRLVEEEAPQPLARLQVDQAVVRFEWWDLFRGRFDGELAIIAPDVKVRKQKKPPPEKAPEPLEPGADIDAMLRRALPFDVNRFSIVNGHVVYVDESVSPAATVEVADIDLDVANLTNTLEMSSTTRATATLRARSGKSGAFFARMAFDPVAKTPTFDLNARLQRLAISDFNSWIRPKLKIDVEEGHFSFYTEVKAENGSFDGYVKPLVEDLNVMSPEREDKGVWWEIREQLVDAVSEIFENQPTDRVATRVPFRGSFKDPEVGVWQAALLVLRNAFIEAIAPGIENRIGLRRSESTARAA